MITVIFIMVSAMAASAQQPVRPDSVPGSAKTDSADISNSSFRRDSSHVESDADKVMRRDSLVPLDDRKPKSRPKK